MCYTILISINPFTKSTNCVKLFSLCAILAETVLKILKIIQRKFLPV